jgi:hypothetical protein
MTIMGLNGKEIEILSIKRITHKIPDVMNKTLIDTIFIEVIVKGKNRIATWKEYFTLEEFKKLNPKVRI